jgi:hypothetical protein
VHPADKIDSIRFPDVIPTRAQHISRVGTGLDGKGEEIMFYHGIKREYVYQDYPILSPRRGISRKSLEQLSDRFHLLAQFGLEPVHLLEAGAAYPVERCVQECLAFGDTVFGFAHLPDPLWQLSRHEVGVPTLDLRQGTEIYLSEEDDEIRRLFPHIPVRILHR